MVMGNGTAGSVTTDGITRHYLSVKWQPTQCIVTVTYWIRVKTGTAAVHAVEINGESVSNEASGIYVALTPADGWVLVLNRRSSKKGYQYPVVLLAEPASEVLFALPKTYNGKVAPSIAESAIADFGHDLSKAT